MQTKEQAEQALAEYHADISAGGEPHYPQWAADVLAACEEHGEQATAAPYGWINAGINRQQTEYATLHVGPENPWKENANAFPVYAAHPQAAQAKSEDWRSYVCEVVRTSDQSVKLIFPSCRTASLCENALKAQDKESGND